MVLCVRWAEVGLQHDPSEEVVHIFFKVFFTGFPRIGDKIKVFIQQFILIFTEFFLG